MHGWMTVARLNHSFSCSFAATTGKSILRSGKDTISIQTLIRVWLLHDGPLLNMSVNQVRNLSCGLASGNSWTGRIYSLY